MDNEQALAAFERILASTSSERLRAARFLAQNATKAHRARLSKIREAEPNSWIRRALEQALRRSGKGSSIAKNLAVEEVRETPLDTRLYETDTDSWIVVLDEGCGLPPGSDRLTEPGTSTKSKSQGHLGMGLPIAQRAIESTQGSIRLTPRSGAGVSCEIRWPRGGITVASRRYNGGLAAV